MNEESQLKLQAFLDGELPETESREVAAWLARDAEATALLGELRNTRKALSGFESNARLPESREFYWSKIEREIRRSEPAPEAARRASVLVRLRRLLVPASAVATLVVIATFTALHYGIFGASQSPDTEVMYADSGTFTYHDYANGTTLVWLSYPAESEFANGTVH